MMSDPMFFSFLFSYIRLCYSIPSAPIQEERKKNKEYNAIPKLKKSRNKDKKIRAAVVVVVIKRTGPKENKGRKPGENPEEIRMEMFSDAVPEQKQVKNKKLTKTARK